MRFRESFRSSSPPRMISSVRFFALATSFSPLTHRTCAGGSRPPARPAPAGRPGRSVR
jgi:hypothetical protein